MKFNISNRPILRALSINKVSALVAFSFLFVLTNAQKAYSEIENLNSGIRHIENVRVSIVKVNEEGDQSGVLKLIGDCEFCDQELRFGDQTLLRTPFYDGFMDVDVLKQQQFARGTVKISAHLMKVSEIHYVKYEY